LFVPVTTPFTSADGGVDAGALRANLASYVSGGVQGIVVCGSTGEAALLSPDEQRRVVEVARDVVPGDRWLVAGTGGESTATTVSTTRDAAAAGADAVLVRPPAYYGPSLSAAALTRHFQAVAEASPVPIFLYNIPKYTHLALSPETVAPLTEHPRFLGLKDSGGDMEHFAALQRAAPQWCFFVGSLAHVVRALDDGAVGGVLAGGCFLTDAILRLLAAVEEGNREAARELQDGLVPVAREIVGRLGVPGVKYAMDLAGLAGGPPRLPFETLDAGGRARVAEVMAAVPR
jgi:dihydrodipicolinate synthase/N-acetylneuraminate lyase